MKRSFRLALCGVAALSLPLVGGCQIVAQKAAETVIKKMGGTVGAADRAPATIDAAYIQSLKPLPSGAGLIVCEPVPVAALQSSANWGAGAARWLQVQVAGQPELGKTPLWGVPENARIRLGYSDWKLDAKRADALGQSCGVSHVAVGTLSGTPAAAILNYQLRDVKSGKVVGTAKISGPIDKLNAQLPALAKQLATQLKVKAALPTKIGLSADEVAFLGTPKLKASYRADVLAPAAQTRLKSLASKDPLAGIMAQRWGGYKDDEKLWQNVADNLLKAAPNNALVWSETANMDAIRIVPVSEKLAALGQKYPNNYLLLQAQSTLEKGNRARPLQLSWAEKAVRAAPESSFAWGSLADAYGDSAQSLRRSRYSNQISGAEWTKLNGFYARFQSAATKATQVEPRDTFAWATLAEAASFNSDSQTAETALEKALALDPRNGYAWRWGMQMTQPKWSGDMNKFVAFATRAASHADDFDFPAEDVSNVFTSAGERPAFKGILQTVVAKDPKNYEALTELGAVYHYDEQSYKKAEALYRQALKANPKYARAMSTLGDLTYWVHSDPKGAEALYKSALVITPKDGYIHANLGRLYALTGRKAQGVAEANLAKQNGFSDKSHGVWDATGVKAPGRW